MIGHTLGAYLSARFARTILGVFFAMFALIYTLDFVELVRRAGDNAEAGAARMATLALFRTPAVSEQVFPFCALFGAMATFLMLSRKLELVVARAAGVSVWQFLVPPVLVALAFGVVGVALFNPISAHLKQRADAIEARLFARAGAAGPGQLWIRQKSVDGQAILRAEIAAEEGRRLSRVTVFTFAEDGRFLSRLEAAEAVLRDGYWELTDARELTADGAPNVHMRYQLATNLLPEQVRQSFVPPETVPLWDLPAVTDQLKRAGLDSTRYELQWQVLLARPFLLVAMVLVAATCSLRFFRFGGVSQAVLSGVSAGFVLYVATQVARDLCHAGLVSPASAAWTPVAAGALMGTLALLHLEDG